MHVSWPSYLLLRSFSMEIFQVYNGISLVGCEDLQKSFSKTALLSCLYSTLKFTDDFHLEFVLDINLRKTLTSTYNSWLDFKVNFYSKLKLYLTLIQIYMVNTILIILLIYINICIQTYKILISSITSKQIK